MIGHLAKKKKPGTEDQFYRNWYIVVDDPTSSSAGRRKQKWISTKTSSRKIAEKMLIKVVNEINEGNPVFEKDVTFAELMDNFEKNHSPTLAKSTQLQYEWAKSKIPSYFAKKESKKIRPLEIKGVIDALEMSSKSKSIVYGYIRGVFRKNIQWEVISKNPCEKVDPPKLDKKKRTILSPEEMIKLLEVAQGTNMYIPILLIISCGMRRGEVCGLRWKDVDLKSKILSVEQSLDVISGEVVIKEPKTDSGTRRIKMPTIMVQELKKWKKQCKESQLSSCNENDYILYGEKNSYVNPDKLYRDLKNLVKKNDLPEINVHGLRHCHATFLLLAGVPVKIVSERLGHSDVYITQNLYQHVLPEMQEKAALEIENIINPKKTSNGLGRKGVKMRINEIIENRKKLMNL